MTVYAFEQTFPNVGSYLLMVMVFFLSTSTVLTFWYYGSKCSEFLFGKTFEKVYKQFYLILIIVGAVASLSMVINFITFMYALMALPTMISTLLLSSKVRKATQTYIKDYL